MAKETLTYRPISAAALDKIEKMLVAQGIDPGKSGHAETGQFTTRGVTVSWTYDGLTLTLDLDASVFIIGAAAHMLNTSLKPFEGT